MAVAKNGLGMVRLAGNNTFTGLLTAAGSGAVVLSGNNSARPTGVNGSTTILNGGVLQLQANGGNTIAGMSTALSNEQTANQPLIVSNGGILQLRGDSAVTFLGGNNLGGVGSATVTFDVNRVSSGTGNVLTIAPLGFNVNTTTINVTGDNGYTLGTGTINNVAAAGNLTLNPTTGSMKLGGYTANATFSTTLTLSGSASGNSVTGSVANPATSGTTTLTKLGTSTWTLNGADTFTGAMNVNQGVLTLAGNRTANSGGINAGSAGNNATLNIQNGTFTVGGTFVVGNGDATSSGFVHHSGGSLTLSGTQLIVGNGGTLGNASTGTYNLSGGTLTGVASTTRGIILGTNPGTTGNFNLSGTGTLAMGSAIVMLGRSDSTTAGTTGTFTQTGASSMATIGTLSIGGGGGAIFANTTGTLSLAGGTFTANAFTFLAAGNTSNATINIGGTADVTLPAFPTARGTSSTATINFDGGTLRPLAASTTYMGGLTNAFVKAGGAKFEVPTGRDIAVTQRLLTDVASTGGGLTKAGNGILALTGNNSFTGGATINACTLNANADAALGATSGAIGINNNATLQAGGALTTTARTLTLGTGGGTIDTNGNTVTFGAGSTIAGTTLTKVGAGKLVLAGTQTYATLNTSAGRTDIASALGTGTSTINASAETNISVDQTLAALNIAGGAVVTFGAPLPQAPAAFAESFVGGDSVEGAVQAVPEPGSIALLMSGLAAVFARRRRA